MTPQEKAKELIKKYSMVIEPMHSDYPKLNKAVTVTMHKNCALITVDEILERSQIPRKDDYYNTEHKYWQDVKEELNKL